MGHYNSCKLETWELKKQFLKMYCYPPKEPLKESDWERTYRMGRNSLILEIINKMKNYVRKENN